MRGEDMKEGNIAGGVYVQATRHIDSVGRKDRQTLHAYAPPVTLTTSRPRTHQTAS